MIRLLENYATIEQHVSLRKYNTYRINGMAKYLISPNSITDLATVIKILKENNVNTKYIGKEKNINELFLDKTFVLTGTLEKMTRNEAKDLIETYKDTFDESIETAQNLINTDILKSYVLQAEWMNDTKEKIEDLEKHKDTNFDDDFVNETEEFQFCFRTYNTCFFRTSETLDKVKFLTFIYNIDYFIWMIICFTLNKCCKICCTI